ncbi:hypothetical protein H4R18_002280 [Coemansia javaensis]|uniref:Cytochrome P450 n=1 Tax=Coemansia javaensis TaxID=2761396 RepID=A0A9W8HH56_9FUNG|nr:hypothetical protein H4R18_002280 [Coemansia javaensis]
MDMQRIAPATVAAVALVRAHPVAVAAVLAAAYVGWRAVYGVLLSPLRRVPGPLAARISAGPSLVECLTESTNDVMIRGGQRYGSVFVMEPRKVALCDPEDCRRVLGSYAFAKDRMYGNVGFMDANIFLTRDAGLNKERRAQIGPALSAGGLRRMEPAILRAGVQQLVAAWDRRIDAAPAGRATVNYHTDLSLMTFDIITSLGFGVAHRSLTTGDATMGKWTWATFVLMIMQMVLPAAKHAPLRWAADLVVGRHVRAFFDFARRAIDDRRRLLPLLAADGSDKPADILQNFIDAEDPLHRRKMTPDQVVNETVMVMLSGADTSSTALTWAIHLLLLHPQHMAAVTAQVRAAFGPDALVTYDEARAQAPLLEACILESLRLCPVSTNLPREVPRGGLTVQGHFIPAGYTVAVSTAACNHNPRYWPDPARFDPARFLPENNNRAYAANRHNLMTFSHGVRVCPGRQLVMVEMVTTLANILARYDLALPEGARFGPHNTDAAGRPVVMPRTNHVATIPKHPKRDCNVVVTRRSPVAVC